MNMNKEIKSLGRGGFEPPKPNGDRFTVYTPIFLILTCFNLILYIITKYIEKSKNNFPILTIVFPYFDLKLVTILDTESY